MSDLSQVNNVVFDFDNTLFDTEKKKNQFYRMAEIHGYSYAKAREIYKQARTENEKIIMSLSSYLKVLKEQLQKDDIEFKSKQVSDIITEMKQGNCLLPYAAEFLKYCASHKLGTFVLSLGQKDWQQQKVNQSEIEEFFPEKNIIFTNDINTGKQRVMRDLFGEGFQGKNMLFINDKPDETRKILRAFREIKTMLRLEKRDDRYTKRDFEQLKKDYPKRVIYYSEELKQLLNKFKSQHES